MRSKIRSTSIPQGYSRLSLFPRSNEPHTLIPKDCPDPGCTQRRSLGADILPSGAASAACANTAGQQGLSCLAAHGAPDHITYLPASRFWLVQGSESGIFLVLALALAIFTYWLVTSREA